MGISIKEAVDNTLISNSTMKILPNRCACGALLEFSDSLKILKCTNKNCKMKVVDRIKNFCKTLNISIQHEEILKIVSKLKLVTPYQLLMLDKLNNTEYHINEDIIQNIKRIKENEYFIYNVAELCGIDEISKIAKYIFGNFNSFDDAYDIIEANQISFLNEHLGIKNSDSTIISVDILNKLLDLKEELIFGETQLKIKKVSENSLRIAFCDNIEPFVNKTELIDYLNCTYKYNFVHVTVLDENTDILIKNLDSNNNKYRIAKIINDKYIANEMNNGNITLNEIGKLTENDIKPIGSKIYIDSIDNIIKRLDSLMEQNNSE